MKTLMDALKELIIEAGNCKSISREYITECVVFEHSKGSLKRGVVSRRNRGLKKKSKSSRGTRLSEKIKERIVILEKRGAICRIGTTHILVLDVDKLNDRN